MINLTLQEKEKFALYLQQEAEVELELTEQMKKVNIPQPLIDRKRALAIAKQAVAKDILSWEEQSIG